MQLAQSVGRFEGHYGYPNDPAWTGSNNWGAIQEPHPTPDNSFEHKDHSANGTPYTGHFRKYATPEAGAKDLLHELYRRAEVRSVLNSGSTVALANAMHKTGYFESSPVSYARNLLRNAIEIARNLGEPLAVDAGGSPASTTGLARKKQSGALAALPVLVAFLLLSKED
jgi:hypothetical protein